MNSALSWIGDFVRWLARFVPRLIIVRSTHAGVRFKRGEIIESIAPGLRIYWPLVTEVEIIPVARQTHNLVTQSLVTSDNKKIVVSGVVVYKIKDVVATMARNWDVSDTISDITLVAIASIVTTHTYDYLLQNLTTEVMSKLTKETRKKLRVYGVFVYWVAFTDFSECMVIKNITDCPSNTTVVPLQ
jgi:regulator of protease activity HflC (stomatin/prohibitin superfamily)